MLDLQIIPELKTQFASIPEAVSALETIAECEGDLEDAAITLAIRVGQQPDINNSEWLNGVAKKYRVEICNSDFRNDMINGNMMPVFQHFLTLKICPKLLILPVLLYVHEQGVNRFCEPLDPL
jgi:hypothetical protein